MCASLRDLLHILVRIYILYDTHFLGDASVIVIDDETLCVCVIQMLAYERTI